MLKVITTVGTSIFQNYKKYAQSHLTPLCWDYLEKPFSERESKMSIKEKAKIQTWLKLGSNLNDISAEVKSLKKLQEERNVDLEVYLITSDTVASCLAAEIIENNFKNDRDIQVKRSYRVEGLQILNRKVFTHNGFPNLMKIINNIINGYAGNMIFNITGGYKSLIPLLTIFGSINNIELVYIYEKSSELITIPGLPIIIDTKFILNHLECIEYLDMGMENYYQKKKDDFESFTLLENRGFIDHLESMAFLSPIGQIFYDRFKKDRFSFYCTDSVWTNIENQNEILRILKTKFCNKELRERKSEQKQHHFVFDDGDNNNRIYYFLHENRIYIYRTFENEEKARAYIEQPIDKHEVIRQSNFRTISLEENNV